MSPALDGVRVLDLSQGIAGPYAAMLLAEQGADVVKVEPPHGEHGRRIHGFHVWNRSKRGIVADIEQEAGRGLVRQLVAASDVVVADYPPGQAGRLSLDYATLSRDHPGLVYCWLPPYGNAGPEAHRPPSNDLAAALGGLMAGQPGDHQGPVYLTLPLAAYGAAFLAAGAVAAALLVREKSGRGQQIEVSLLAGALAMETGTAVLPHHFGSLRADLVHSSLGPLPAYRLYRAPDGWLFIACGHHMFFNRLCLALGRPDLVSDPRFENAPWGIAPQENRDALVEILSHIIASRPRDEWLRIFREHDVPCAPVEERSDFIDSELVRANDMRLELDDPELGPTVQMGLPIELEGTPGRVKGPAPLLGQHSEEVLAEFSRAVQKDRPTRGPLPRHALEGIRVVDFSGYIAGAVCPMILADYGADVIKVEPPQGEAFRVTAFAFMGWNRGKRGIALDLNRPEARDATYDLLRSADVLMENFRPGVAERLGLDYETVRQINPRLIYSSSGGWGRYEPLRDLPAFDPLLQARSGAMVAQGGRGYPPVYFFSIAITDYAAAMLSAYGICAALYARERTGQGQKVSIALMRSIMAVQSGEFLFYEGMEDRDIGGPDLPGLSTTYRLFRCADDWLFVAASREEHWPALARLVDLPESLAFLSAEEALGSSPHGPLARQLAVRFAQADVATWRERLDAAGVPCASTPRPIDALASPQVQANGLAAQHEHPQWGPVTQTGLLVKFSATPGHLQRPAPLIGQHTREVLRDLGYAEERIEALLSSGAAVQAPPPEPLVPPS